MGSSTQVYVYQRKSRVKVSIYKGKRSQKLSWQQYYVLPSSTTKLLGCLRGLEANTQGFTLTKFGQKGQI